MAAVELRRAPAGAGLVGLLVRLRLTLLANALRRSVWRTVGLALGAAYALGAAGLGVAGLVALRWADADVAGHATVVGFAGLTVGWLVLSALVFGTDETVDPARFALLPLRAGELLPGLLVSGLIGVPGVLTAVLALAQVVTWSRGPATVAAAVLAAVLGVLTCFLLSRASTTALARALSSRRFRDLVVVVLAAVAGGLGLVGGLVGQVAGAGREQLLDILASVGTVAGWTPFGWAWAVPGDVAAGRWGPAAVRLVLAALLVVGLWWAWAHFLARRLVEPLDAARPAGAVQSRWVDRLFPASPAGAVAARTLRYWRRDPRYLAAVAVYLVVPVVVVWAGLTSGPDAPLAALAFTPVLLGALLGSTQAQDLSYDGSAVWLHVACGVAGSDDRAGRVLSSLVVFGPLLLVFCGVGVAASGDWGLLVPTLAATVGVTLISAGVGAWTGSLWQWPAPPPGANPFGRGSTGGLPGLASFAVTSAVSAVAALPVLALVVASFWVGWLAWPALVVGVALGLAALRVGITSGGRRLDGRWPEVLRSIGDTVG